MRLPVRGQRGVSSVPVRSPTLPPATHTNAWVLGERDVVVVDPASPSPDEQRALAVALSDLSVRAIVLTHHHDDHVGGAQDLRARTGAPVLAHPLTAERVAFPVDGTLVDGGVVATDTGEWRALHTPGHASGHLCLHHAASGAVVAGDMVASVGTIVLDPPEGQLGRYIDSLQRLRRLAPAVLLPAHGGPIEDADDKLAEYIDHRHMRTEQYRAVLARRGPSAPIDVVPHVYTELPETFFPIAARQVLCHLHWLAERSLVCTLDDGRWALVEGA